MQPKFTGSNHRIHVGDHLYMPFQKSVAYLQVKVNITPTTSKLSMAQREKVYYHIALTFFRS